MKSNPAAFSAVLLTLLLSGCVVHVGDDGPGSGEEWKARQEYNRDVIAHLEIGQTRANVEERLGRPDFTEAYVREGAEYHILHYRTQHRHGDGKTTRDETTPLVFRDGHLEGWGDTVYSRVSEGVRQ